MGGRRGNSGQKSKEDLWKGAIELDIGDGNIVQLIGMDSAVHVVFARAVGKTSDTVSISKVVRALVDEEYRHVVKDILEKGQHVEVDSHPPAEQLMDLGAVWLINETAYTKGEDTHAHRLSRKDEGTIPDWEDETLRVHYVPDRFHMAHEVDWTKYCKGLLIGETVQAYVAGGKPHVPMTGLPDSKDGVIVYKVRCYISVLLDLKLTSESCTYHGTSSSITYSSRCIFDLELRLLPRESIFSPAMLVLPRWSLICGKWPTRNLVASWFFFYRSMHVSLHSQKSYT